MDKLRVQGLVPGITIAMVLLSASVDAQVISAELDALLRSKRPNETVPVIVTMSDRVDPRQITGKDPAQRRTRLIEALHSKADATQGPVVSYMQGVGATRIVTLWIINSVAAHIPVRAIDRLARLPGVASIYLDATVHAPSTTTSTSATPEWNLDLIGAPVMWGMGYSGLGVVVASMDTGVDANHPDLRDKWRGGSNSWFDPHQQHATPYDANGHGTQTMGLMVGGSAGGTAIGVAPDAQWIAVKIFDDAGQSTLSVIHQGFQWLLDPDGNPATDDAPGLVNNSWGIMNSTGQCITEFQEDIRVLKTAEIGVVFSAGNDGPDPSTSTSPGNNTGGFAVGAVDGSSIIASFSSRGPSACDAAVFPRLVAPGVTVKTTDLSFGGFPLYATVLGTSFAAPHVAGALALLKSAFPAATVAELESALQDTAQDLGTAGADDSHGYGLLDVADAYNWLLANHPTNNPVAVDDAYSIDQDLVLHVAEPGVLANDSDADGDPLAAIPSSGAANGLLILNADGSLDYTPNTGFTGTDGFTYMASDGKGYSSPATVTITVNAATPPADKDGDGHPIPEDCDDNDAAIHPGAPEIKHDGIDQDCNGYDLTIDIVKAEYQSRRSNLTVEAVSDLGTSADLRLDGFGAMQWNSVKKRWTVLVRGVNSVPATITVSGIEGAESAPVKVR